MNRFVGSIILIALLMLGACTSTGSKYDQPKVDLVGLEPVNSESGLPRFLVKMRVVNPNNKTLLISGVYYEISVEGKELFTGATDQQTEIPAYGENIVTLEAAPSLFGTIGLFRKLMVNAEKGKMDSLKYSLYTKIQVTGRVTPLRISHTGKLDLSGGASGNPGAAAPRGEPDSI